MSRVRLSSRVRPGSEAPKWVYDEILRLEKDLEDVEILRSKAIRFDLDRAGIEQRERESIELFEARAEIKRLNDLLSSYQLAKSEAL